ncbi:MAG: rhodanese-like domain-containing protein [candidate division FCPU426 bacterium]
MTRPRLFSASSLLGQTLLLAAVASGAALLANQLRPHGLAWRGPEFRAIALAEMTTLVLSGQAQLVDARPTAEFAAGHVAGALNLPEEEKTLALQRVFRQLPEDQLLIVYCRGPECQASLRLARFLAQNGVPASRLAVFQPGWEALQAQTALPLATGAAP